MYVVAETAVRDRIGKGHNPDITPLSGIVAKLKAQQTALAAKCVFDICSRSVQHWSEGLHRAQHAALLTRVI